MNRGSKNHEHLRVKGKFIKITSMDVIYELSMSKISPEEFDKFLKLRHGIVTRDYFSPIN